MINEADPGREVGSPVLVTVQTHSHTFTHTHVYMLQSSARHLLSYNLHFWLIFLSLKGQADRKYGMVSKRWRGGERQKQGGYKHEETGSRSSHGVGRVVTRA